MKKILKTIKSLRFIEKEWYWLLAIILLFIIAFTVEFLYVYFQ
jgi:hypothetical protein